MTFSFSLFGIALTFVVHLHRLSDAAQPPSFEANGAGQFELAAEPLWAGDEFGFRSTP